MNNKQELMDLLAERDDDIVCYEHGNFCVAVLALTRSYWYNKHILPQYIQRDIDSGEKEVLMPFTHKGVRFYPK